MHPVLFQIGDFVIGTYGLLIVVGLLSGLWSISRLARRRGGMPIDFFYDLLFLVLIAGFLGARLTFIALNWGSFLQHPAAMIFSRQGFVFLGGFVAAVAAAVWYTRRRGLPILEVADLVAPGLVLGHAFGRIGCFLAGCCFGMVCTPETHPALAHISVSYPVVHDAHGEISEMFNFAYITQVLDRELSPTATRSLPMVPAPLMESAGNFMICILLLWLWRRRVFSGQIAAAYLSLYSVLRFGLEFWRGDADRGLFLNGALSTSQIICIVTLAGGIALWLWRRGRGVQEIPVGVEDGPEQPDDPSPTSKTRSGRRRRKASSPS
jgi:phosphatidylglycerol:prolipoprotein diacylglycerol transferase